MNLIPVFEGVFEGVLFSHVGFLEVSWISIAGLSRDTRHCAIECQMVPQFDVDDQDVHHSRRSSWGILDTCLPIELHY